MCVRTDRRIDGDQITVSIAAVPHSRGTHHNFPQDHLWNWTLNYRGTLQSGLGNCGSYEVAADEASKAIAAARHLEIEERRKLNRAI